MADARLVAIALVGLTLVPTGATADDAEAVAPIMREALALEPSMPRRAHVSVAIRSELSESARDAEGLTQIIEDELVRGLSERGHFVTTLRDAPAETVAVGSLAARRGAARTLVVKLRQRTRLLEAEVTLVTSEATGLAALVSPDVVTGTPRVARLPIGAALIRFFEAPARLEADNVVARSMPLPGHGYLALGAADLDGDGQVDLALIAEDRVDIVRLSRGRTGGLGVRMLGSAPLDGLRSSPAPSRRPVATATRIGDQLIVTTSAHASPFEVRHDTGAFVAAPLSEAPCPEASFVLPDACAERAAGRDYFRAELLGRDGEAAPPTAPAIFYARAARTFRQADGSLRRAEVVATARGRLSARIGAARGALRDVGSALAMADVDADGAPELLTSASAEGSRDRLSVTRLVDTGTIARVWTSAELEGRVFVAAAADLDDDGAEELLAIEEPETPGPGVRARLWVVK